MRRLTSPVCVPFCVGWRGMSVHGAASVDVGCPYTVPRRLTWNVRARCVLAKDFAPRRCRNPLNLPILQLGAGQIVRVLNSSAALAFGRG